MERRSFTRDFKLAAVKKVLEQGLSYRQVARDLGIRDTYIHNWRNALEKDGSLKNKATNTSSASVEAELKRLREENRQLKMERDILKKATAFFAKEND